MSHLSLSIVFTIVAVAAHAAGNHEITAASARAAADPAKKSAEPSDCPAPKVDTGLKTDDTLPSGHSKLADKEIGVVIGDPAALLLREGRRGSGAVFATGTGKTPWIYAVSSEPSEPEGFFMNTADGRRVKIPNLLLTNPAGLKKLGLDAQYSLVSMEINNGQGSAPSSMFAATKITRLDGTPFFRPKLPDVIEKLNACQQRYTASLGEERTEAMEKHRKATLGDRRPNAPEETTGLVFPTWVNGKLRVTVFNETSTGLYSYGSGTVPANGRPGGTRYGVSYGVRQATVYEVNEDGGIVSATASPLEPWVHVTPHPQVTPPRRPR